MFSLPEELQKIFGDDGYARHVKDLEVQELALIIHIDSDVIYLNSQIVLMPQRSTAAA